MSDHVKFLPDAAIPPGGVPTWSVADAERWRAARLPAFFAPAAVWALAPLVLTAIVLLAWNEPAEGIRGTVWESFPPAVVLFCLPLWYRMVPAVTAVAAFLPAGYAVYDLAGLPGWDTPGRIGNLLVLALCGYAATGALLRLRARRRQRGLMLAAAGKARHRLPEEPAAIRRRRGLPGVLTGAGLCLAAAALLGWALSADLGADRDHPYDATGQQILAMLLLMPGVALIGHGLSGLRAARRLRSGPQPALLVGVRGGTVETRWLYPDARTPDAPPLISYAYRYRDWAEGRTLLGGPGERLRVEHHDINQFSEPYEAILYGPAHEGAEVLIESAYYHHSGRLSTMVTVAQLLPRRRHGLSAWRPAGTSYRLEARRPAEARRAGASSSSGGDSGSGGCGSGSSSCGSSFSSSCGGGCGGGD
ncbi:hypothetical protein [Streptomyces sp. NPDC048603]|uniref:hypothetical protein n=1 Tax=Streptomyces sp. NPDC048603 TaxID=3365577 RepID=UPI00371CC0FD